MKSLVIEDLRLFLSICDLGNLSAAARLARTTPSTVSRRITALEERLGAKLLSKSTRRLSLTAAGRALVERARSLVQEFDSLREELSEAEQVPGGLLRISASTGFGGRYIAPLLGEFRRLYPGICIDLQLNDAIVNLVANEADIAIRIGQLQHSQLRHVSLGPLHRIACASPSYLAVRGRPTHPDELRNHECIVVGTAGKSGGAWRFRGAKFRKIDPRLIVSSHEAAAAAARSGGGIAHLPFWLVREEIERGDLEQVLAEFDAPDRAGVHLLWHERPTVRVRAFVEFVRQRIRAEDLMPARLEVSHVR